MVINIAGCGSNDTPHKLHWAMPFGKFKFIKKNPENFTNLIFLCLFPGNYHSPDNSDFINFSCTKTKRQPNFTSIISKNLPFINNQIQKTSK